MRVASDVSKVKVRRLPGGKSGILAVLTLTLISISFEPPVVNIFCSLETSFPVSTIPTKASFVTILYFLGSDLLCSSSTILFTLKEGKV